MADGRLFPAQEAFLVEMLELVPASRPRAACIEARDHAWGRRCRRRRALAPGRDRALAAGDRARRTWRTPASRGRGVWIVRRTRIRVGSVPALRRAAGAAHLLQRHRPLLGRAADHDRGGGGPEVRDGQPLDLHASPTARARSASRATSATPMPPGAGERDANVRVRHPEPPADAAERAVVVSRHRPRHRRARQQHALLGAAGGGVSRAAASPRASTARSSTAIRPSRGRRRCWSHGSMRWIAGPSGALHASIYAPSR